MNLIRRVRERNLAVSFPAPLSSPVMLMHGDVMDCLAGLPDQSIDCCITSPPYWGLRDYGTANWEGGDARCDHKQSTARKDGGRVNISGFHGSATADSDKGTVNFRDFCRKCGARRIDNQLGLERTPDEYVTKLVDVFREVRRVLRNDGTLWLNLGDSYNAAGRKTHGTRIGEKQGTNRASANGTDRNRATVDCLKPKDMIGIPWRVAFALQADGWYLRQDIIWHKPNPMPESVRDRCTKAHEYLFLLSKQPKYFYDTNAVREPLARPELLGHKRRVGPTALRADGERNDQGRIVTYADKRGRNRRSVWTICPKPFRGAHFAVMPEALVEPCILAGSRKTGTVLDPFCGSGTVGVVALRHNRQFLGIDLNAEYLELAKGRMGFQGQETVGLRALATAAQAA